MRALRKDPGANFHPHFIMINFKSIRIILKIIFRKWKSMKDLFHVANIDEKNRAKIQSESLLIICLKSDFIFAIIL